MNILNITTINYFPLNYYLRTLAAYCQLIFFCIFIKRCPDLPMLTVTGMTQVQVPMLAVTGMTQVQVPMLTVTGMTLVKVIFF